MLLGVVQGGTLETDVGKITPMTIAIMDLLDGGKKDIKSLIIPVASNAGDVIYSTNVC
jgi:hypothetical protein